MAKTEGLGSNFYINQFNVSGDIAAVDSINATIGTIDTTGIDKYAFERVAGLNQGQMDFTTHFNTAAGASFAALSTIPTTDVQVSYFHKTALGNAACSMIAKQLNHDGTRAADGGQNFAVSSVSNGYGLEWGRQLTAGVRTDTAATNGTAIDTTASLSFGAQAYLHVFAFTGTDVTVTIQDSADNVSFNDVISFTATTAVGKQRIATSTTENLARYVRAITTTSAGFTSVSFAVNLVKNKVAAAQF